MNNFLRRIATRLPYLKDHVAYTRLLESQLAEKDKRIFELLENNAAERTEYDTIGKLRGNEDLRNLLISKTKQYFRYLNKKSEKVLSDAIFKYYPEPKALPILLYTRLEEFRCQTIPWLESIYPLKDAKILEIGCGTGSSTVALSEQGAFVVGIDVDELGMEIAKKKCELYDLQVDFKLMNATDIGVKFDEKFDFVIFFAAMEHMTHEERITSIRAAYSLIDDGVVVVVETPNRLWFEDNHTSFERFFHWLPDEIAMDYAAFTKRELFNTEFLNKTLDNRKLNFARWGRGVSYHEFQVALNKKEPLNVVSSMQEFLGFPWYRFSNDLKRIGPEYIHDGFYEPNLYIALKK